MSLIDDLRRDGIAYAPHLTYDEVSAINRHFLDCLAWPAHVVCKAPGFPGGARPVREALGSEWPMFSVMMQDVVTAPRILERAIECLAVARDYFGETPRLYSMNCFWSQPAAMQYGETHWWHRDGDDRKQMAMFIFGTDVLSSEDGAHLYQRGTHKAPRDGDPSVVQNPPDSVVETVTGISGTVFVTDPWGGHMGLRPLARPRMFAWARFGVSDMPASYPVDQLRPVPKELIGDRYPSDPAIQEAIRLVVS